MGGLVTIFAPDGTKGEIPYENLHAAIQAGAKPAVTVKAPDGSLGDVPADRMQEAVKAGGQVVPFQEQENQHPGLWHNLASDLWGMAKNAPSMLPPVAAYQGIQRGIAEADSLKKTGKSIEANHAEQQKAAGYSPAYRYLATPAAEGIGVNVQGAEQSAAEGDEGGVAGHVLAVPVAAAVTDAAIHGLPVAARVAEKTVPPTVRAIAKSTNAVLAKAPATAGAIIGGGVGGYFGGSIGAEIGTGTGAILGKEVLPKLRVPGEQFGIKPVFSQVPLGPENPGTFSKVPLGPDHPGVFSKVPLGPDTPLPEQLNPAVISPSRTMPGQISPEVVAPPKPVTASPLPPRKGLMLPSAPPETDTASATASRIDNATHALSGDSALRQILGGQDNPNLLRIAKSRGINVTKESLLKPGTADNLLINKIINDFSPDELDEVGARYLENNRFKHAFGDIGPEAWKTLGLKSYFPDLKVPDAMLKRTQAAIDAAAAAKGVAPQAGATLPPGTTEGDLSPQWQEALRQIRAARAAGK